MNYTESIALVLFVDVIIFYIAMLIATKHTTEPKIRTIKRSISVLIVVYTFAMVMFINAVK